MSILLPAEEYAVYNHVLIDYFVSPKKSEYAIADTTIAMLSEQDLARDKEEWPELLSETADDFKAKLNVQLQLEEKKFTLNLPVALITAEEMEEKLYGFPRGGWDRFHKTHPHAGEMIQLSRVGFDKSRNQALVCVGAQRGVRAGLGTLFFLSRSSAGWVTQRTRRSMDLIRILANPVSAALI
jgi:hypothetical protein